ncbi:MAG: histidine--tRNA ligase [Lachnospiraceae bacterium]|nr:histidine--tRNA ligase [Lachnospiraceae bacterium]
MKITSVKGTLDYLPKETALRDYLQNTILDTYRSCGFERITTPILEDIENLDKSEGGENLNLIFKVMKRGEKFTEAIANGKFNELSDIGLRYDLTLPLSRYYACNKDKLSTPFKVIQVDRVFRAERPQKGRLREFVQCDIDILGSESINCEIELIDTTAKALLRVGIDNFKVKINDRRILRGIITGAGFEESECDSVCITFDKLDKVGIEGVKAELEEKGFKQEAIDKFIEFVSVKEFNLENASKFVEDKEAVNNLATIISTVKSLTNGKYDIVYDPSLVRGQGYYTGTVFEVESLDFHGAIAGGGRYDNLIGKFLGQKVPAVGFSIGFERIAGILLEKGASNQASPKRIALIYNQNEVLEAIKKADELRKEYYVTLFEMPKKLGKFYGKLEEQNYYGCLILGEGNEMKIFG